MKKCLLNLKTYKCQDKLLNTYGVQGHGTHKVKLFAESQPCFPNRRTNSCSPNFFSTEQVQLIIGLQFLEVRLPKYFVPLQKVWT